MLEAGGRDNWIWFHIPVGYLFAIGNPRSDWCFKTEPEPGLNGRSLNYPRGKVIGGSSAINAMVYMRGQAADYDHWRQLGLTGWGWDDVLPFFKRHENHFLGETDAHGAGGELPVAAPRVRWDLLDAFRAAAAQAGIKSITDFNTGDNEGCCAFHVNQKRGRRWSAASAFLKPALNRANLRLETGCLVESIMFDGRRAVGVRWRKDGETRTARCRGEVILAAGSIGSTQIMLLSGVGPAHHCASTASPSSLDRPGVGANLQDHLQLRLIYKVDGIITLNERYHSPLGFAAHARRICAVPARTADHGAVAARPVHPLRSATRTRANLQYHVQPLSLDRFGEPLHKFPAFTASVANLQPTSRGSVRLRSRDPAEAPLIKPNYLSTDEDRRVAAQSIRLTRRIVAQPALAPFHPDEYLPGAKVGDDEDGADQGRGRHRHHHLSSGRHRENGPADRPDDGGRRPSARRRRRSAARHRRLRHADHHLRQHQCADHDDRGKRRRADPRRRQSASRMNAMNALNARLRAGAILADPAAAWARHRAGRRRSGLSVDALCRAVRADPGGVRISSALA